LYELGDLDDFFFPDTAWHALVAEGDERIAALALLYSASELPVLIALARDDERHVVRALLEQLAPLLPNRFYAHLAPGTSDALGAEYRREPHGLHDRMMLVDRARLEAVDVSRACALGPEHSEEVTSFYARVYPENWFSPRMLETRTYFGLRRDARLVSVAGVHVVSREQRVAALGNVATDPDARGQGLGRVVTAAVCKALAPHADPLGLNVEATNVAAIALYRSIGFERTAVYEEVLVTKA
jgi:ribosomal protein S18 acetylase RimI-like enzyme